MSRIAAYCHWPVAEDICIVVDKKDCLDVDDTYQIPMDRKMARELAYQLLNKADYCDQAEKDLESVCLGE